MANTCEIADEVVERYQKFKLNSKASAALILKIDPKALTVCIDEEIEDVPLAEIASELPPSAPRYIAYSYKHVHKDGRCSYPLVFIFYCPNQINPTLAMLYSSTKTKVVGRLQISKIFDVHDQEALTEQWLIQKLGFFG
eukprot:TRINITY_DN32052_c0_g1_i1.p2 TRINITY_DN32052_c0_g1~~TRINITY_DN32052_c0_g1_i1.p2  ORF type:complete len:139 (+),score=39.50 TRINITY_DN32052_c0_g1_i1:154-570(+)